MASPETRAKNDDELKEYMSQWEAAVTKYEVRWQPLPDETKVNAVKAIVPHQLLENRFRGTTGLTYVRAKRDIENYLNDKPQALSGILRTRSCLAASYTHTSGPPPF